MSNTHNTSSVPSTLPNHAPSILPTHPPTPRLATNPNNLPTFDTSLPIHRFDFPDAATQAAFHRSFALLRTEKDKAEFMQRFFDNYDGQVSIPKKPARYDTSNDEALAKRLMDEAPPPPTDRDGELARVLQEETPLPDTRVDGEVARVLQEETSLMGTQNDARLARMFQDEIPRPETHADEAMTRGLQEELSRGHGAQQQRPDQHGTLGDDFGRLTFAKQRRPVTDGYGPTRNGHRPIHPRRGGGPRGEQYPPPRVDGGTGGGRGTGGYGGPGAGFGSYYGYERG